VRSARADDALGQAMAIYDAPVVPVQAPAPGSPAPVPQPGTYQSEDAKLEAALPKFIEAADRYPNTQQGIAARYHAAGILARLGRFPDAEKTYQEVVNRAGDSIYGRTARLGLADVQIALGKYDNAISVYTELSRDSSSHIPVDGILMQLGRAYARAGRKEEAVRAFNRIVTEFPESLYAADARREMDEVRKL
jgi:TolA-binding protein